MKKLLLLSILLLAGCAPASESCPERYEKYGACYVKVEEKACIDQGGVPLFSGKASQHIYMSDCKFNETTNK